MIIVHVKVSPNAAKNSFEGWQGDVLRVRLHAAPEKGRANETLIAFLSQEWGLAKSQIRILSGATSRLKRIAITGKTIDEIKQLVSAWTE